MTDENVQLAGIICLLIGFLLLIVYLAPIDFDEFRPKNDEKSLNFNEKGQIYG